jgi:serine protease Do
MEQEPIILNEEPKKIKFPKSAIISILIMSIIISTFFGAVFGFMAGGAANIIKEKIGNKLGISTKSNQSQSPEIIQKNLIEEDSAVIDVVKSATPAVVSIVITKDVPKYKSFFDSPFGNFFDPFGSQNQNQNQNETEKQKVGSGSGFFVNSNGTIVTNKHVVEDTTADYTVITNDGTEYPAKVLARHPIEDIAVIKIEGSNFPAVNLGDSDSLQVGQTVIAIGNPLGEFANSVSKGIISGLKRNLTAGSGMGQTERLTNIIQTDAAINPGNSGGPLLDVSGNVIGINVAMAQGAENIGFALPVNQIKKTVETVEKQGKISIPFLGVRYVPIDEEIKKANNLPFDYGVLVLRGDKRTDLAVVPGSPADKAGIVENDIILEINGQKITSDNPLADIISKFSVGDTVTIKFWDKGNTKTASVVLTERQ